MTNCVVKSHFVRDNDGSRIIAKCEANRERILENYTSSSTEKFNN